MLTTACGPYQVQEVKVLQVRGVKLQPNQALLPELTRYRMSRVLSLKLVQCTSRVPIQSTSQVFLPGAPVPEASLRSRSD